MVHPCIDRGGRAWAVRGGLVDLPRGHYRATDRRSIIEVEFQQSTYPLDQSPYLSGNAGSLTVDRINGHATDNGVVYSNPNVGLAEMFQHGTPELADRLKLWPLSVGAWQLGTEYGPQHTEFMTVFSHELRNSLSAVRSATEVLRMEVKLCVERGEDEATVRIRDTGIGIAPDVLPYVFDLFVQANPSSRRADVGLGIGLALVRSLVERMVAA